MLKNINSCTLCLSLKLFSILVFLTGCTSFNSFSSTTHPVQKNANEIETDNNQEKQNEGYEVIGKANVENEHCVVTAKHSPQAIQYQLKEQAATRGGTAITNIKNKPHRTTANIVKPKKACKAKLNSQE